jgi:hypothetical protein
MQIENTVERRGRMVRMSAHNQRVVGSNPAKAQRGICEQDTLNPQLGGIVAIISRIACGTPNVSK